jgi:hypothetical protein
MDGKKRKVSASAMTANRLQAANVSTIADTISYPQGSEVTGAEAALIDTAQIGVSSVTPPPATGGDLNVSLSPITPPARDVPAGSVGLAAATAVPMTIVQFAAGDSDVQLKGLNVQRTGLSQNSQLANVMLFLPNMQRLGVPTSFDAANKAKFNFNHTIPAGQTQQIIIAAHNYPGSTGRINLGIESAADIITNGSVKGSFPIVGNTQTQVTLDVGRVTISKGPNNPSTASTVDIGDKNERLMQVRLTAGSVEKIAVSSMGFKKGINSTFDLDDLENYHLVNDRTGQKLADGVVAGDIVSFKFDPVILDKGDFVDLSFRGDILDGAGKTVSFTIVDEDWAVGSQGLTYGFGPAFSPLTAVGIDFGSGTQTETETALMTISQGSLVMSKGQNAPVTGNIAAGASDVKIASWDLDVRGENMKTSGITTILACGGTLTCDDASHISNMKLVDANGKTIAGPYDPVANTLTPGSSGMVAFSTQIDLDKGNNEIFLVGDFKDDAPLNGTIQAHIVPTSFSNLKGYDSGKVITPTPNVEILANTLTVKSAKLSADMSIAGFDSIVAGPFYARVEVRGPNADLGTLILRATDSSEDVKVTSITITAGDDGPGGIIMTDNVSSISNYQLFVDGKQVGETEQHTVAGTGVSTPRGSITFNIDDGLIVPKGGLVNVKMVADTSNALLAGQAAFEVTAISAVGNDSGKTISGANLTLSTADSPSITWTSSGRLKINLDAGNPAATNVVAGSTGVELARYKFEALYEDVDVTEINLWAGNGATSSTKDGSADADFSSVKVYAGTKLLGTTSFASGKAKLTLDAGDFRILQDDKAVLSIKADLSDKAVVTSGNEVWVGIADSNEDGGLWNTSDNYDLVANGVASGTAITVTNFDSAGDGSGDIYGGNKMTLHDGLLTVKLNGSSPSGNASPGAAKDVLFLDLTATGDDITVTSLTYTKSGSCTVTGTNDLVWQDLASNGKTYYTWSGATAWLESGRAWTGGTVDSALEVAAGETKSIRLTGATTGCTTDETLDYQVTAVTWAPGSESAITNDTTLDNLPVNGGTLKY